MTFDEEKKANVSLFKSKLFPAPSQDCSICMSKSGGLSATKHSKVEDFCPKCGLDIRFSKNIMVMATLYKPFWSIYFKFNYFLLVVTERFGLL